jgi:hypothetical protein
LETLDKTNPNKTRDIQAPNANTDTTVFANSIDPWQNQYNEHINTGYQGING